jgi:hypothetical protein
MFEPLSPFGCLLRLCGLRHQSSSEEILFDFAPIGDDKIAQVLELAARLRGRRRRMI